MIRTRAMIGIIAVGFFLLMAGRDSQAALIFSPVTWSTPTVTEGWSANNSIASLDVPGGGGYPGGFLQATFPVNGSPFPLTDQIGTGAANMTGDYTAYNNLAVGFDFYTQPGAASALFFTSTANGGSTWGYAFSTPTNTWDYQLISFAPSTSWVKLPGSGSGSYADALKEVSFVGIQIQSPFGGGTLDYGIDNWQFNQSNNPAVPEPSSVMLLISAVLIGLPLYRRFRKTEPVV